MKSKIFLFNKTIFCKNMSACLPIWCLYLIYLTAVGPGRLWMEFSAMRYSGLSGRSEKFQILEGVLDFQQMLLAVSLVSVLLGMVLFYYLCVAKSAYMIHAFPMTRLELYATNVASGLICLMVPQLFQFLLSLAVCLAFGMTYVHYLAIYLLMQFGVDLLMFGIVVLCTMIAGQMIAIPIFFGVANFLWIALRLLARGVLSVFGYGLNIVIVDHIHDSDVLSPFLFLWERVYILARYDEERVFGLEFLNAWYVAAYLVPALLLYVAAWLFYRKRPLENAGDLVTVGFVRPLFRWGVGFFAAYLLGGLGSGLIAEFRAEDGFYLFTAVLIGVVCGVLFFFLSLMLLEKSFRIFNRRVFAECGCFIIALLVSTGGVFAASRVVESYIPERDQIQSVTVSTIYGIPLNIEPEKYDDVIRMHEEILTYEEWYHRYSPEKEDTFSLSINYQEKDGQQIERSYILPKEFAGRDCYRFIAEKQSDAGWFVDNLLFIGEQGDAEWIRRISIDVVYIDQNDVHNIRDEDIYQKGLDDPSMAVDFFEALLDDAGEQNLQKYNRTVNTAWGDSYDNFYGDTYEESVYITFSPNDVEALKRLQKASEQEELYFFWQSGDGSYDISFNFGKDCRHLIAFLSKYGVIQSEEELHLYNLEE